jgi:ketosteroid isomerase-like protein
MTRFKLVAPLSLALVLMGLPAGLRAQEHDHAMMMAMVDSAGVAAVVNQFHAALKSGDADAVKGLLLPTARIIEGSNIETAEKYMSGHMRGDMSYAAGLTREILSMEVFQLGEVAWATSRSHTQGESRGRVIDSNGAEMMVLQMVEGTWRIAAIQWS